MEYLLPILLSIISNWIYDLKSIFHKDNDVIKINKGNKPDRNRIIQQISISHNGILYKTYNQGTANYNKKGLIVGNRVKFLRRQICRDIDLLVTTEGNSSKGEVYWAPWKW